MTETMLFDGIDDDSLNRSKALQMAVKQVTDPLMLSDLMKTTQSPFPTTESKKQRACDEKENMQNFCSNQTTNSAKEHHH